MHECKFTKYAWYLWRAEEGRGSPGPGVRVRVRVRVSDHTGAGNPVSVVCKNTSAHFSPVSTLCFIFH